MKHKTLVMTFLLVVLASSACGKAENDHKGPVIAAITASNNVLVISDCLSTSVTISARVTDDSGVARVGLWFRAGSEGPFKTVNMILRNGHYEGTIKGGELLGQSYGALEFYITAEDGEGSSTTSPTSKDIQFLPCVNN
jgi:hypothetical protein